MQKDAKVALDGALAIMSRGDGRKAWARLQQMRGRATDLERRLYSGLGELERTRQSDVLDAAAQALIDGAPSPADLVATIRADVERTATEQRVLHRALEMQERAVDKYREADAAEARREALPGYRKVVARVAVALEALSVALAEEHEMRRALVDAEVSGIVWMLSLENMRTDVEGTRGAMWVKDARESGLID